MQLLRHKQEIQGAQAVERAVASPAWAADLQRRHHLREELLSAAIRMRIRTPRILILSLRPPRLLKRRQRERLVNTRQNRPRHRLAKRRSRAPARARVLQPRPLRLTNIYRSGSEAACWLRPIAVALSATLINTLISVGPVAQLVRACA